ncbi:MAG TPA: hypothetical protein VJB70_04020 [Candidatus Paceibacterota bacterium]
MSSSGTEAKKFYSIGTGVSFLKVGFQLNFDLPLSPELEGWITSLDSRLVIWAREKVRPVVHVVILPDIYEQGDIFSAGENRETRLVFSGAHRSMAQPLCWLLLRRKNPDHFMVCGRIGPDERSPFGFSMLNEVREKKGWATERLQPLAYPGKNGIFNPVFVKMMLGEDCRTVVIRAEDVVGGDVSVRIQEVANGDLPPHLRRMEGTPRHRYDD